MHHIQPQPEEKNIQKLENKDDWVILEDEEQDLLENGNGAQGTTSYRPNTASVPLQNIDPFTLPEYSKLTSRIIPVFESTKRLRFDDGEGSASALSTPRKDKVSVSTVLPSISTPLRNLTLQERRI